MFDKYSLLFFLFTIYFISEMEDDYFSVTIPVSTVSNRGELSSSSLTSSVTLKSSSLVPEDSEDCPEIKDEPISEPPSPCTPCQLSCDIVDDKSTIKMVPSQSLHYANARLPHTSDSEEENEECSMVYHYEAILRNTNFLRDKIMLKSHLILSTRVIYLWYR